MIWLLVRLYCMLAAIRWLCDAFGFAFLIFCAMFDAMWNLITRRRPRA
jgi:hypothetical protein